MSEEKHHYLAYYIFKNGGRGRYGFTTTSEIKTTDDVLELEKHIIAETGLEALMVTDWKKMEG